LISLVVEGKLVWLRGSTPPLVDYVSKLVTINGELYKSGAESSVRNENIETITEELLSLIRKVKGVNSRIKSFRMALRSVWSEQKIQEIERRLEMFREAINLRVVVNFRTQFDLVTLRLEGKFDNLDANARLLLDAIIDCRDVFETKLEEQTETLRGFHANTAAVARAREEARSYFTDVLRLLNVVSQDRHESSQRESEKLQETMLRIVEEMEEQRALIERLQRERERDPSLRERLDLRDRLNTAYAVLFRLAMVLAGLQLETAEILNYKADTYGPYL
ncbi:uncharacterized protein LY89DRAFT_691323, partial [Mollisia scopiformis]